MVTVRLDRAAYLILMGASLAGFEGESAHNCKVNLEVSDEIWIKVRENKNNLVNYKQYMAMRTKLKRKMREKFNALRG